MYIEEEMAVDENYLIRTENDADKLVEYIKIKQAQYDIRTKIRAEKTQELKAAQSADEERLETETAYAKALLRQYMANLPTAKSKTQESFTFASGKAVIKYASQTLNPVREKLIDSLGGTEYVEYEPKLKWAEFKKTLKIAGGQVINVNTGEVIDQELVGITEAPEKILID